MRSRVLEAILQRLQAGEVLTKYDAASAVFCDQRTAQRALDKLHETYINIVVRDWVPMYHQKIPAYGVGTRDKPKPRALTAVEIGRRRRKDIEFTMTEAMKKRAKRARENWEKLHASP